MTDYASETLKKANYKYIKNLGNGSHLLLNLTQEKNYPYRYEEWGNSLHYAGYTLKYKNTQLEFIGSVDIKQVKKLLGKNKLTE